MENGGGDDTAEMMMSLSLNSDYSAMNEGAVKARFVQLCNIGHVAGRVVNLVAYEKVLLSFFYFYFYSSFFFFSAGQCDHALYATQGR